MQSSMLPLRYLLLAVLALPVLLPAPGRAQDAASLLAPIFGDHAVVQRDVPLLVWGTAAPGDGVSVSMAGAVAEAKADGSGRWMAELPALPAGGPHTIEARSSSGAVQSASDVLVGDVFFCSGQSNMAFPVSRTLDAEAEIRNATNERIRMLTIETVSDIVPRETLPGKVEWEVASPETVADWSGTCYYFARELQPLVDVPIGLINSSWGGSDIRAWMSQETLAGIEGYEKPLALLRLYATDQPAAQRAFGEQWEAWWRATTGDAAGAEPWQPQTGASWPAAPETLSDWKRWGIPELEQHNGMLWHRATFTLTAEQAAQDATLSLGGIDEVDQTWINGHVLGNTFGWGTERTYPVPAGLLREGENVVVVNVLNTWGAGGLTGDPSRRTLVLENGTHVPLSDWRYHPVPLSIGPAPRTPWEAVGGLSTIYNVMAAPLNDYRFRGVIWYQGESNTGEPESYRDLLRALIAQWRAQFGAELPVLVVQLPNFGAASSEATESDWAKLRESQRLAVKDDPHAALVVTIDVGDPNDIHPTNKQDVGRRLARAARHVVYGEAVTPSGPVPVAVSREGDTVAVTFGDIDGELVARGSSAPTGFALCGTEPGSCRYVDAQIDGNRVLLRAGDGAERVRYCWGDNPVCTLYDTSGLPAGPFELRITGE